MGKESKMGVPPVCLVILSSSANLSFFIFQATIPLIEQGPFYFKQFLKPSDTQPLSKFCRLKGIETPNLLVSAPDQLIPGPLLHLVDFQAKKALKRDQQ